MAGNDKDSLVMHDNNRTFCEKIIAALITGGFIRKTSAYIRKRLDFSIGCVSRAIYSKFVPVNPKKVMFMTFQGDYTCNPKYITEELLRRNVDCEIVWAAKKAAMGDNSVFPERVYVVEDNTFNFFKEFMSSKILIHNSINCFRTPTPKKNGQYFIETWHGSLGIKRFAAESGNVGSWLSAAKLCGKDTDFVISNSSFEDDVYRDTYWEKSPILRYGHPRNDILFQQREDICQKIRETYKIPADTKILLYAPTFRGSKYFHPYTFDYQSVLDALSERFGGKWLLMIRFHPHLIKASQSPAAKAVMNLPEDTINATEYPDIQELMLFADAAITDYSSWIFDYVLTGKPGFIYATDKEAFDDTEKILYYPLESTPFPIAENSDELIRYIKEFDTELYEKRRAEFLRDKGCVEDGRASERVVNKIIEIMEGGSRRK